MLAPTAHYEMAVIIWHQHGTKEAASVKNYLTKCASWEPYELDNRYAPLPYRKIGYRSR